MNFIEKLKISAREVWREKTLLFIALFIVVATIVFFSFSNTFESQNDFYQAHNLHPPARTESLFLDIKLPIWALVIIDLIIIWVWNTFVFMMNRFFAYILIMPLIFFYQYIVKSPAIPGLGMELSLFFKASATVFSAHATLRMVVWVVYAVVELTVNLFWILVCTKEVFATVRGYRMLKRERAPKETISEYLREDRLKGMHVCCILLLFFCAVLESLCGHVL